MRKVIIRVDAGQKIGFGHAVRSLSLARYLRRQYNVQIVFYSEPYDRLESLYQKDGVQYILNDGKSEIEFLHRIKEDNSGSVLFIDKLYPYDRETIRRLRDGLKIIMFQNVCEGMFESHFAIFASAHLADEIIEDGRWSYAPAEFLYGPKYVIINEQVANSLAQHKLSTPQPYIAISTGATDPKGISIQVLEWLNESDVTANIKVLLGFDFCHKARLKAIFPHLKRTIEIREFNYRDLFSSRLAIVAFGATAYELIYANIPIITIGHIRINSICSERLQGRFNCNYHLGLFKEISKNDLITAIQLMWNSENALLKMKTKQKYLIDGRGLERIGGVIHDCYLRENFDE